MLQLDEDDPCEILIVRLLGIIFPWRHGADSNSYLGGDPTAQLSNQFPINSLNRVTNHTLYKAAVSGRYGGSH